MSKGITPAALGALLKGDLENFLVASTPGGIEAQEKAGQTAFVNSTNLPIDGTSTPNQVNQLTRMGITLGEPVDDIFRQATLPQGWKKVATDHDMWSKIVDNRGRERAAVFYKAAFYDRSARLSLTNRFSETSYQSCTATGEILKDDITGELNGVFILDCGKPTKFFGAYKNQDYTPETRAKRDAFKREAQEWLIANYPNYQDPEAYWD